ncbi:DUF6397 family protein, partial [Streptomyces sp. NPDC006356]
GPPASGAPGSPASLLAERIMTADDPDEISLLRADLAAVLQEARERRPAPRPTGKRPPAPAHPGQVGSPRTERPQRPGQRERSGQQGRPEEPQPPRGLLSRFRRRSRRVTTT